MCPLFVLLYALAGGKKSNWVVVGVSAIVVLGAAGVLVWRYLGFLKGLALLQHELTHIEGVVVGNVLHAKSPFIIKIRHFLQREKFVAAICIALIVLAAAVGIVAASATQPAFEAESAQLAGNAKVIDNNVEASGGKYVLFQSATAAAAGGGGGTGSGSGGTGSSGGSTGGGGSTSGGSGGTTTPGGSTTSCAPYPSFPDASCTGPTGTLTAYTGPMEITTPGAVIENVVINTSMFTISASNVTLRNCKVIYTGALEASWTLVQLSDDADGAVIDHCEIDGKAKVARGISGEGHNATVKNSNIHDTGNGVELDRSFTVRDSYIWNIYAPSGTDWHSDGIQGWGDASGVTVDHNTIYLTGGETGAVNFSGGNTQSNNLVQHNLLASGGYTIYVGAFQSNTNVRVINNHLSTRYYPKVGQYGIWAYDTTGSDPKQPGVVRTGNVIHETGVAADTD